MPKYHKGEWVTCAELNAARIISIVDDFRYEVEFIDGRTFFPYIDYIDKDFHRWTIKDAKDGDILVDSDSSIFIFAGAVDCACKYYAALTNDNMVKINKEVESGYWETSKAVCPATKEQRNLLFQKMKESGYRWDAEKRELKKVEQNNTWKPTVKQMNALDSTLQYNQVSSNCYEHLNSLFNDLKKLKEE